MSKTKTLQCPMIHLNGSSAQTLLEDLSDAYSAVNAAMDVMRKVGPNGRDFYTMGPEAMTLATDQHRSRCLKLQNVLDELEAIIGAIEEKKTTVDVTEKE